MALRISRVVNVTLLHKRILVLFALLAVTPAAADERADKAHYDRCLAAAQANPAGALGDATSWTHAGGGAPHPAVFRSAMAAVLARRARRAARAEDPLATLAASAGSLTLSDAWAAWRAGRRSLR